MYQTTLYLLAAALVLLGWACYRVLPRLPGSGGACGLRFWLALLLVVVFDRTLNAAFFTATNGLYDETDALLTFIQAVILVGLTDVALKQSVTADGGSV